MGHECNHNCGECGEKCSPQDFRVPENKASRIKKVIAVASGKGGVGKSLVTSLLAVAAQRRGLKTALLDADITGPSIPLSFGVDAAGGATEDGLVPATTKTGIKIVSINLLLEEPSKPVIWRGPVIAGVVKQFWSDVCWGDVDIMFVDMPPGTGDVPLTVFQSLPVDGVVIVTSPQQLVGMIVGKAISMAETMNIPIAGIVENMSYFACPECGCHSFVYGKGSVRDVASLHSVGNVASLPVDSAYATMADAGRIEEAHLSGLDAFLDNILSSASQGNANDKEA